MGKTPFTVKHKVTKEKTCYLPINIYADYSRGAAMLDNILVIAWTFKRGFMPLDNHVDSF